MSNNPENDVPADAQHPTAAEEKKPLLPPSRIVFLIFVVVAAIVIFFEYRAKSAYDGSVQALEEAYQDTMDAMKKPAGDNPAKRNAGLQREDLEDLLHGNPDRDYDESAGREVITWAGALRSYRITVTYVEDSLKYKTETPWRWED